jgi:D-alanyl-D-alanine carboxypeptidase
MVPALLLGYAFHEAGHPAAVEGRKQSPDPNNTASYSSSRDSAKETMSELSAELSDAGILKLKLSARERPSPSPPAKTCDDLMVMVGREDILPPDYAPPDLVPVEAYGVAVYGDGLMLRRGAAQQLARMAQAAGAAGEEIVVFSAYRSYYQQGFVFTRLVSIYGEERARWMSAPPGQSQHQLGTAVDFTNSAVGYEIHKAYGRTTASAWLLEHAPEYGFVLSYPNHAEEETGYRWEPWHYRYVGVENARQMIDSGMTLQAFLSSEGVKPRC